MSGSPTWDFIRSLNTAAHGTLLRAWGVRGTGGNDEAHFNKPTDVAVSPDGSFYVSDGYVNSRVVKFSAEGKFQLQWHSGKGARTV
jgi:peptidylamidoglycolate lyase